MFETAEIGNKIDKVSYEEEVPRLRKILLELQKKLATSDKALVVLISGNEGAGKGEVVNLLLEWMDARGIETHAMWDPTDEEQFRPRFWRFWRLLPPVGRMAIFFGSWYTNPIIDRVFKRKSDAELNLECDRIVEFERMLYAEGVHVLKLWLHLSKAIQKSRFKELESDPKTAWRVTPLDWQFLKKYNKFRKVSEHALHRTNTGEAPWHIIEASNSRYRNLTVARILAETLQTSFHASLRNEKLFHATLGAGSRSTRSVRTRQTRQKSINVISQLNQRLSLDKKIYQKKLLTYQGELNAYVRKLEEKKRSVILVFEGADAAGKGGAIRRLTQAMDARFYQVISVMAPTDEEKKRPYLWRFWRHLPQQGRVTIYDRSWYGRVLVERIEGFCATNDWQRAYSEITAFEEQLAEFGIIIMKFWLALTFEEQLSRFKDRQTTPYKQYKLTEEDWRNRNKWNAYEIAACEMIEKTNLSFSPWVLVAANNKYWARIKVLQSLCKRLSKEL